MTRERQMAVKIDERKRLFDMSTQDLATICGLDVRTMRRRMQHPELFRLDELVRLEKKLKTNLLDTETLRDKGYL